MSILTWWNLTCWLYNGDGMYVLLDGHYIIIQKRKCLVFSLRYGFHELCMYMKLFFCRDFLFKLASFWDMACCQTFVCRFLLLETDTEHLLILWICCIFQGSDKLRQDRFFFFLQVMRFHFQNSKVQEIGQEDIGCRYRY